MSQYIFAYGSLIESNSRKRTAPSIDEVWPARVKGFVRGWFGRIPTYTLSTTFLGCIGSEEYELGTLNSTVNGVFFKVNQTELIEMDKREIGYTRTKINNNKVDDFLGVLKSNDELWIYTNKFISSEDLVKNSTPNKKFPIVQSYVDICINGCFEIENQFKKAKDNNFLKEFISQTLFWNEHWVNDRIYPRRPFIYCPKANEIDKSLVSFLPDPELFNNIKIE